MVAVLAIEQITSPLYRPSTTISGGDALAGTGGVPSGSLIDAKKQADSTAAKLAIAEAALKEVLKTVPDPEDGTAKTCDALADAPAKSVCLAKTEEYEKARILAARDEQFYQVLLARNPGTTRAAVTAPSGARDAPSDPPKAEADTSLAAVAREVSYIVTKAYEFDELQAVCVAVLRRGIEQRFDKVRESHDEVTPPREDVTRELYERCANLIGKQIENQVQRPPPPPTPPRVFPH